MAHTFQTCLPPFRHLSAPSHLSQEATLAKLQDYLQRTETTAYLRPDAIFLENHITTSIPTADGGIVLHQLRRVESALRGVRLGLASIGDLMPANAVDAFKQQQKFEKLNGGADWDEDESQNFRVDDSQPVDKSYNEQMLEQDEPGILEGEIGERSNAVLDEADLIHAGALAGTGKKRKAATFEDSPSKEDRKKAKKERIKEARQEESRKKEAEAHRRKLGEAVEADEATIPEEQESVPEANDPPTTQTTIEDVDSDGTPSQVVESAEPKLKKSTKKRSSTDHSASFDDTQEAERIEENGMSAKDSQDTEKALRKAKKMEKKRRKSEADMVTSSSQLPAEEIVQDSPLAFKHKKKEKRKSMPVNGVS